jgi:hypothetical protein
MDTVEIEQVVDQRSARQQRRRARNSQELSTLLADRQELSGVSLVADFFVESVRWTA